jgi:hypothetical protein
MTMWSSIWKCQMAEAEELCDENDEDEANEL